MRNPTKDYKSASLTGFTLIELLLVVGIMGVLGTVAIAIINPAERLKEARDSQRISDLNTVFNAIDFFLQENPTALLAPTSTCANDATPKFYVSVPSDNGEASPSNLPGSWAYVRVTKVNTRLTNGNGWIPLNIASSTGGGSGLAAIPVDPINRFDQNVFYGYACRGGSQRYELDVRLESQKFGNGGSQDKTSKDGGTSNTLYETGSDLTLAPL